MSIDMNEIKLSYGRCLLANNKKQRFFDRFYEIFLASDPSIKDKFAHTDFERQAEALQHGLTMAMMYAERKDAAAEQILNSIRISHSPSNLNINREQYLLWIEALLQTVREYDSNCNEELLESWRLLAQKTVDYLLSK